jgi:hypothetical protein
MNLAADRETPEIRYSLALEIAPSAVRQMGAPCGAQGKWGVETAAGVFLCTPRRCDLRKHVIVI